MKKYRIPFKSILKRGNHNDSQELQMKNILTKQYIKNVKKLEVLLGEDENHKCIYLDISKVGNLILSGVPRSGKSVCIHTILTSLLLKNSYEDLKLVLIDPKQVEFDAYNDLPHLAIPILKESKMALAGLKWINEEIDRRKTLLKQIGISNFLEYERIKVKDHAIVNLSKIVIVADEYEDLITQFDFEAKDALVRVVQRGPSVGIHFILSTVRPTINIIFGTLKASISTRIAFRVAAQIDSNVIIDQAGAESLKGKGDMLLKYEESCIHVQGTYIDGIEVKEICDYIRENYSSSYLATLEELEQMIVEIPQVEKEDEELLYQIALFCIETGVTSVNSIQTNFALGFNRATAVLNELENRKILSPKQGTKGRVVLVDSKTLKRMFYIFTTTKEERNVLQEAEESRLVQGEIKNESFNQEEFFRDLEDNFIEQIGSTTKEILIKYDLLNCIFKVLRLPSLINLDFNDYVEILNRGSLYAYCKEELSRDEFPTIVEITNPHNDISIVFNVSYPKYEKESKVENIKNFFKAKYPSADFIYGESYDNKLEEGKIGIFALIIAKE